MVRTLSLDQKSSRSRLENVDTFHSKLQNSPGHKQYFNSVVKDGFLRCICNTTACIYGKSYVTLDKVFNLFQTHNIYVQVKGQSFRK
jgi:hypothetical protein